MYRTLYNLKTVDFYCFRIGNNYIESTTYRDQTNFVACVLYLEPTANFPDGLILTGGNDNTIRVYKPHEPFATVSIKSHTNAGLSFAQLYGLFCETFHSVIFPVCCLSKGAEVDSFLSGSWDCTARIWSMAAGTPQTPLVTLSGHSAAVWSVIHVSNGTVVTASADKTIRVHTAGGQHLTTLQGE